MLCRLAQLRRRLQRGHRHHGVRHELYDLRRPRELDGLVQLWSVRFHLQRELQEVQQRLHPVGRLLRIDRMPERHGLQRGEVRVPIRHQRL